MNPCHVMDYLMMICHCLAQLEMGGQWQLIISSGFCLHVFDVSVLIHVECVCVCVWQCVCALMHVCCLDLELETKQIWIVLGSL